MMHASPQSAERTPLAAAGASLVVVADFDHGYESFPLRVAGSEALVTGHVVEPFRESLREVVPLQVLPLPELRERVRAARRPDAFVVTLDGGVCFERPDFQFDITRACYKIDHAHDGPYFRLPRNGRFQSIQQVMQLRTAYEAYGGGRPIVVCDDGIGTGQSLREFIHVLGQFSLEVDSITVLVNPRRLEHIDGVPVNSLLDFAGEYLWLNERDLYWGLPRSGLSLTLGSELKPDFGIPYTLDVALVAARVGVSNAADFRTVCLQYNQRFWQLLERLNGRALLLEECPRLSFLRTAYPELSPRVVEFLQEIADPSFSAVTEE